MARSRRTNVLGFGATRTVRFEVPIGQLGFHDRDMAYVVEPGEIEVFVGTSATNLHAAGTVMVKADGPVPKVFDGTRTIH